MCGEHIFELYSFYRLLTAIDVVYLTDRGNPLIKELKMDSAYKWLFTLCDSSCQRERKSIIWKPENELVDEEEKKWLNGLKPNNKNRSHGILNVSLYE